MPNIVDIIDDQACRMRGRAVQFDGKKSVDDCDIADLFDSAFSNLSRAEENWMKDREEQSVIDATDVCNLLAIAISKMTKE